MSPAARPHRTTPEFGRPSAGEATATLDLVDVPDFGDPLEQFQRIMADVVAFERFLVDVAELGTDLTGTSKDEVEHVRALVARTNGPSTAQRSSPR
jgi:hypothetical protein